MAQTATAQQHRQGRPGHRAGHRHRVPRRACPRSTTPSASSPTARTGVEKIDVVAEVEQHLGENRVRAVAMKPTDGMTRGMTVDRHRRADLGAGRPGDARPRAERARRAGRLPGSPGAVEGALADPPPRADARGAVDRAEDVRDRHQGHRPARAVPAGRQDRPVRRRRRRQDRHHHGADQQHRHEARRRVGVRRRRRAHARGQRPLARVPGVGRHRHRRTCRSRAPRWSTAR